MPGSTNLREVISSPIIAPPFLSLRAKRSNLILVTTSSLCMLSFTASIEGKL